MSFVKVFLFKQPVSLSMTSDRKHFMNYQGGAMCQHRDLYL